MSLLSGLVLLAVFVTLEAFFSGSEIALINADRVRLQTRAEEGDRGAQQALELLTQEQRLLGTCLIGTNLSTVAGSTVAATLLLTFGLEGGWATTLAFTPLVLIFGEALPKTVMQHHANRVAPMVAGPLSLFSRVFAPFLFGVDLWSRAVTALAGPQTGSMPTREDLLGLLEEERGPMHPEERRLIKGVLSLTECNVEECMTPLVRVVGVNENVSVGVAADLAARTNHSRLPVYRGRIDHVVGMVHQVDLLFVGDDDARLADHIRPVRFVPEAKSADELFQEMRLRREHFVVVVDEYGGCVGIVTLEDLLEVFVGDIADEREDMQPEIREQPDGSWLVPGHADLEEIERITGITLPEGDYETIAGLVLSELGYIPEAGEVVEVSGAHIHVEDASDRAVRKVRLRAEALAEAS